MAVLDLRPESGSILDRLLRLGLIYDHEENTSEGKTVQYWMRYDISLKANFETDGTDVTFTDMDTRLSKTISATELKTITSIVTWRSKNGAPGSNQATSDSDSGSSLDLSV